MYDDEEDIYYRNYYDDEEDDWRNAVRVRSHGGRRPPRRHPVRTVVAPVAQPQPIVVQAPWDPTPPVQRAPVVDRFGGIKLGLMLDAAAQVFAAMTPLPATPIATGDTARDLAAIMEYQSKLAQHAKRDEQIRTAGAIGKLFLV